MTYVSLQFSSKPILGGRSGVTGGETHLLLDELAGLHPRRGEVRRHRKMLIRSEFMLYEYHTNVTYCYHFESADLELA
jgi:hypothetical protein